MGSKIEQLNSSRRKMVIGVTIGFGCWLGSGIINIIFIPLLGNVIPITTIFMFIGLLGFLYYLYYLFKLYKLQKDIKHDTQLSQALNDEFYKHIRLKSYRNGFYAIIIWQILLPLIVSFGILLGYQDFGVNKIPDINLFIGIMIALFSYLYYDREQVNE